MEWMVLVQWKHNVDNTLEGQMRKLQIPEQIKKYTRIIEGYVCVLCKYLVTSNNT